MDSKKRRTDLEIAWIDYMKFYDFLSHTVDIRNNGTAWSQKEDNKTNRLFREPMEYTSHRMWNMFSKYSNKVWSIPWRHTITLLFCVALDPLSTILNQATLECTLIVGQRLNHLLYMDDLKLYV